MMTIDDGCGILTHSTFDVILIANDGVRIFVPNALQTPVTTNITRNDE
jgi:hypothetical protein